MQRIFVFGSNLAGRHGRGSALHAVRYHGAKIGIGEGIQGNSYGIPTKDRNLETLSLAVIHDAVVKFILFAQINQQYYFDVVPIGCGLAGYQPYQIAPMFRACQSLKNVFLPVEFKQVLGI